MARAALLESNLASRHMLRRPKWRREDLVVPKVMDDFVTKRVLAMEFIPGAKVTDWAAKETKPEKRKEVMAKLIDFYGAEVRRFQLVSHVFARGFCWLLSC